MTTDLRWPIREDAISDLVAHLQDKRLARQECPEELLIVTDFTRTASGKVRNVDLRRWLRDDDPTTAHDHAVTSRAGRARG